jgi:hypothetical protein
MVVTILSSASAATTGYSYKKSILLSFSSAWTLWTVVVSAAF